MVRYAVQIFRSSKEQKIVGYCNSLLDARKKAVRSLIKKDARGWQAYIYNVEKPDRNWGVGLLWDPGYINDQVMEKPSVALKKGAVFVIYDGYKAREIDLNGRL